MILASTAIVAGLAALVWGADRFVEGAASAARTLGMSPLLIGMLVVGFGTSAPEMLVSAMAAAQGNPNLALGNAFGSNITNIALVLGATALLSPIVVQSDAIRRELPILLCVTALAAWQISDGALSRAEGIALLSVFAGLMSWALWEDRKSPDDQLGREVENELEQRGRPLRTALFWLLIGLFTLIASSKALVWGAVQVAQALGVSDLVIGLTIIAIGTSLPELASSLIATRKGEHDIAFGNVLGSNLFNTLAVLGIAATINPLTVDPQVWSRDLPVMVGLTFVLMMMGLGVRGRRGRVNRLEGGALVLAYVLYLGWLAATATS